MSTQLRYLIVRELAASDLGWFDYARQAGLDAGRQRAINLNRQIVEQVLTPDEMRSGEVEITTRCSRHPGAVVVRPIRKQQKNWRLVGDRHIDPSIPVSVGDFFVGVFDRPPNEGRPILTWDVLTRSEAGANFDVVSSQLKPRLRDSMASTPLPASDTNPLSAFGAFFSPAPPVPSKPETPRLPKARPPVVVPRPSSLRKPVGADSRPAGTVRRRLASPSIMSEIMTHAAQLSAELQSDFLERLEKVVEFFRVQLTAEGMIERRPLDHRTTWDSAKGQRLAFVDGGVASIQALGAAPLGIRVGCYTVVPGLKTGDRETFSFVRQMVDDLFDQARTDENGVYEDNFDDLAKLRDAARMSLEAAAVLAVAREDAPPAAVFVQGPLVNPVSPYALPRFPAFRHAVVEQSLLVGHTRPTDERSRNFVSVYLDQLLGIQASGVAAVGVIERASTSTAVADHLLNDLTNRDCVGRKDAQEILDGLRRYRISDAMLFECVLELGEYLKPFPLDKNEVRKAPQSWQVEVAKYPRPVTTYLKVSDESMPLRIETFEAGAMPMTQRIDLVFHMARLLPRYAFPVGLDIVDKYAKVPDWMSRSASRTMGAQMLLRACETRNPNVIRSVQRMLAGNSRDFFFRPKA